MKTILGLDLGIASIGWAIVNEQSNKRELIKSGVRIIPIDNETASDFSKGNPTSKNADRRLKRSARKNNDRYKLRKYFLKEFLNENKLLIPKDLFNLSAFALYELRHKALSQKISKEELARIWFHLNQKRGYIDSRKGLAEDEKDTKYVEAIKNRSKHLYDNYETVGSYFYFQLKDNPIYRVKAGDDKENIFLVDDYKLEFDLIWNEQKKHYPDLLTETNYERLRNRIIYYKRKLKSQRHLIGECRYERHHKCMPVSSPIAEEIKLWQDINNLQIQNKYNEIFYLTEEQKIDLFNFLYNAEKINDKDLLKKYNYPTSREGYKLNFEKGLRGYTYRARLIKLFNEHKIDFAPFDNFSSIVKNFSFHPYYQLWHLLYSVEEIKDLKNTLKAKYGFEDLFIDGLLKLPIKNDFAAISTRAARKLLPHLKQGKKYSEACDAVGYKHSDSLSTEENKLRKLIDIKKLPLIKPNQLRNPTVEKILNQLINLLIALDSDGYKFDEIRIELARDLKKNANERKRITERNRENETANKDIIDILKKEGFLGTKKEIEKYKLWKEFDRCSPYEPGKTIELGQLLDKAMYEIEHIIPRSRYFDDSLNNKTIARVNINKEKDKQTAFDYMSKKPDEIKKQYIESIKQTKLSRTKKEYLMMEGSKIPEDFINRQLNETRYITSETLKILKSVCKNVTSTTGTVTDYLRHHWGYDKALMQLNFDRVSSDEIEYVPIEDDKKEKRIKNWNKRLDHRHHALDAIVIACTTQSHIQQLNTLNHYFTTNGELKSTAIRSNIPFSFEEVKNNLNQILVSFKAGKKVATIKKVKQDRWGKKPGNFGQTTLVPRGALHEESIYGSNKKYLITPIKALKNINQCADKLQYDLVQNHITKYNNDLNAALKNLQKDPIKINDEKNLETITIFKTEHVKKYNLQYTTQNKFDVKAASSIVNENVKRIVLSRLAEYGNDPAKAFKNLNEKSDKNPEGNPLYFNKEKGIVIKTVRCYTGGSGYPALHASFGGITLNEKQGKNIESKLPVDFIIEGNNHHISIFEDDKGEKVELPSTFFQAFERKRSGQQIIATNHPNGYKFLFSLQRNEMFVFGLSKEQLKDAISQSNNGLISNHLYRVLNIAPGQYFFIHHLETKIPSKTEDKQRSKKLKLLIQCSAVSVSNFKVTISKTGKIKLVND